jgi:putative hydrolase of the HAD superfamily
MESCYKGVKTEVVDLYLKSRGPSLDTIRSSLLSKTWFGFDLDDTLHEFRKASSHASSSVFQAIQKDSDVSVEDLKASYGEILHSKTASAFADGRTSTEYRRERFTLLLQANNLETPDAKIIVS